MPNVALTSTRIFPRNIEHLSEKQGPPRRVVQLPIGQALGTSKLRSSANGGMSAVAPEQLRGPDPFRSNASGSTSAVLPEQPRGSEPRRAPEPRREPEPSNEVRSSKSEAERKQEEHLAMIKRMEQEILDEEEEAEREAEAMNDVPTVLPQNLIISNFICILLFNKATGQLPTAEVKSDGMFWDFQD
ncbi:hypothetical protein CAEBREN_08852 [Caenorhabditis brenneri]|uniref:Uncharacterized protein n=1 Tax=Caenorhabditis brenneri TaxID=135651 RepID=G0NSU4_CAEBE|nr:hypothetical protein CAEBREN_08852 [Caenorhabditis brenneri]